MDRHTNYRSSKIVLGGLAAAALIGGYVTSKEHGPSEAFVQEQQRYHIEEQLSETMPPIRGSGINSQSYDETKDVMYRQRANDTAMQESSRERFMEIRSKVLAGESITPEERQIYEQEVIYVHRDSNLSQQLDERYNISETINQIVEE